MADKIGKYEVIRTLGKGATAVVYLARDPDAKREVAIKLIRFNEDNAAMSRRLRKLFLTEDSVGRRLEHPNIVRIHDAVVEDDKAWLVMEYVKGQPLDEFCTISKLLPMHRVIGIIFKCCLALDHAFRQGVVHRDIKPANILISDDDEPKITDFGLALNLNKNLDKDSTFVMGVGSPAYMSPEQIKNYPLNQKTDLYSLGVVLFQLLTGRLPFRARNQGALVYKIVNSDTPSVCALNPNLPEDSIPSSARRWRRTSTTGIATGLNLPRIFRRCAIRCSMRTPRSRTPSITNACANSSFSPISRMSNSGRCCGLVSGANWRRK